MSNALIYLRVSTPEQVKQFSVPAQLQMCREYAERQGLTVADDPVVDDESGASLKREHWPEVERRLLAGEVKHLIIFALDRLTREPADFFPLRKRLHAKGVRVHLARGARIIDEDPVEQLGDDLEVVLAKRERAVLRHRSMAGRAAKIASGRVPGNGLAPYGFRYEGYKRDRHLVINEDEAAVVRRIAQWFVLGDGGPPLTLKQIAHRLYEQQVPTRADLTGKKRAGFARWNLSTVADLLRDPSLGGTFYANRYRKVDGKSRLRPREEWTPIPVPAILEPDLLAAVQRKLDQGRALATRNNTKRFYLLRCRVRCTCGRACVGWTRGSSDTRYYRCMTSDRQRYEPCGLPYVQAAAAEVRAWEWLRDEALREDTLLAHLERRRAASLLRAPQQDERDRLNAELRENEAAQGRLLNLYLSGVPGFDLTVLEQRQTRLKAQEADIHRRLAALDTTPAAEFVTDAAIYDLRLYARIIREGFTDMTPTEQRQALDMVDARFVFSFEDRTIVARASCVLRLDSARLVIGASPRGG